MRSEYMNSESNDSDNSQSVQKSRPRLEFDESQQVFILRALISSKEISDRSRTIIQPRYFDRLLHNAARYILDSLDRNVVPLPEQIRAHSGIEVEPIASAITPEVATLILEEIEQFCRLKEATAMVMDSIDLINKGEFGRMEEWAKQVNAISVNRTAGFACRTDFSLLLRQSIDEGVISTGWNSVDEVLYGGLQKTGLTIFGGQSGGGKSNCLINLALNWQAMGKNVAYITLEMPERVINLRWAAMITGMGTKEIRADIEKAELKIAAKLKSGYGDLFYMKMPEGGTTAADIRAYLGHLISCRGIALDAVICDYLDLLCPSKRVDMSNLFVKDKYVSEELRALAFEFGISVVTASQLNRGSYTEGNFDLSHMAGGMSKINTADDVIFIRSTPAMKEQGQLEFQFLKTRNSGGVGKLLVMKCDPTCMRISDGEQKPELSSKKLVVGKLLNSLSK